MWTLSDIQRIIHQKLCYSYHSTPGSRTNIYHQRQSKLPLFIIKNLNSAQKEQQKLNNRIKYRNKVQQRKNKYKTIGNCKKQEQNQKIGDYIRNLINRDHNILQKSRLIAIQQLKSRYYHLRKKQNKQYSLNFAEKENYQKKLFNKLKKYQSKIIQIDNNQSQSYKYKKLKDQVNKFKKGEYSYETLSNLKQQTKSIQYKKNQKIKIKQHQTKKLKVNNQRSIKKQKQTHQQIYTQITPLNQLNENIDDTIQNILKSKIQINLQFQSDSDVQNLKSSCKKLNSLQEFINIINDIKRQLQQEKIQLIKTKTIRGFYIQASKTSGYLNQVLQNSKSTLKYQQVLIISEKLKQLEQIENNYNQLKLRMQLNKKKVSLNNRNGFLWKSQNKQLIEFYSKKVSLIEQEQSQKNSQISQTLQITYNQQQYNKKQTLIIKNQKKPKAKRIISKKNIILAQENQMQTINIKKQKSNLKSNSFLNNNKIRSPQKHTSIKKQEKLNFELNEGLLKQNLVEFLINHKDFNHVKQDKLKSLQSYLQVNPVKNSLDLLQKSEKYKLYLQQQEKFTKPIYFQQKHQSKQSYQFDQNLINAILQQVQKSTINKQDLNPQLQSSKSIFQPTQNSVIINEQNKQKESLLNKIKTNFKGKQLQFNKILDKKDDDLIQKQLGTKGKLQSIYICKKNRYFLHKIKNKHL